jgi:VWFA-related protein
MTGKIGRAFLRIVGIASVLTLPIEFALSASEPPAKPRDIGLTEQVRVRLVTMDVVVLDKADRAVPGLGPEDFDLRVDGTAVPVDTLDESCDEGGLAEPAAVREPEDRQPPVPRKSPVRIAWVLDYLHLDGFERERVLETLRSLARGRAMEGAEILVAALTGGLRVEQPFTRDLNQVVRTLERMERDITLWNGNFAHTTEEGLFAGLESLCDVLAAVQGPKAVVLYSQWQGAGDLHFYESNFRDLAALAADAWVTFYPVEAQGITAYGYPGGSPGLHRLGSYTGGRVTRNTNDMTLAVARAERDLACRYTIGFYDRQPTEDQPHEVRVDVRRSGLRVLHASDYTFRSKSARQVSLVKAAFMVPGMFETGIVRAYVFPLQPLDKNRWRCLVSVEFSLPVFSAKQQPALTGFGFTVRDKTSVVHSGRGEFSLRSLASAEPFERRVTYLDETELRSGEYTITAVTYDPITQKPSTADVKIVVPKVPRKGRFLVGPYLGRRAGEDLMIRPSKRPGASGPRENGGPPEHKYGSAASFEPLLVNSVERGPTIVALTQACVSRDRHVEHWQFTIQRSLVLEDGTVAGTFPDVPLEVPSSKSWQCQPLVDLLPSSSVRPGTYRFTASMHSVKSQESEPVEVVFSVAEPADVDPRKLDGQGPP